MLGSENLFLMISRYQSQKFFQKNSYSSDSASEKRNFSMAASTSWIVVFRREMIHREGKSKFLTSMSLLKSTDVAGMFIKIKRVAFHILLAKLRPISNFSLEMKRSCPELMMRLKRRASAPYSAMISKGSIALPSDLDILRPCAS